MGLGELVVGVHICALYASVRGAWRGVVEGLQEDDLLVKLAAGCYGRRVLQQAGC